MRNFICLFFAVMIIILAVPTICFFAADAKPKTTNTASVNTSAESENSSKNSEKTENSEIKTIKNIVSRSSDKVKIYISETKKVETVSLTDYLISAAGKEVSANAPAEALKAQILCCYTYLLYIKENYNSSTIKGADISNDSSIHQAYLTKDQLKKFWGPNYNVNYKKLKSAVESVYGEYISYDNSPILAAYHSSNSGYTESSKAYWGSEHPYLTSVISIGDKLSEDYRNTAQFTPEQLKEKLGKLEGKNFIFSESPSDWLGEIKKSKSGTVLTAEIGGITLKGSEIRSALELKSSVFTVIYKNGKFIFTTDGYGHGVGLSQAGAQYMAKLGFSYKDIIYHYYNGVEILGGNNV